MSFGIGRDFAGALAPQIDGKLRPYLRQALCSVVEVGSGANTGQVRVRIPGEDVLTADLRWAPVYGAVPAVDDVVRTFWDHASRFVVTTSAGGGGGSSYYQTVAEAGTARTQRATLNFGNGLDAVDNSGSSRTDVTVDEAELTHNSLAGLTTAGAHPGTAVSNTPAGDVTATTMQAAIDELDARNRAALYLPSGAIASSFPRNQVVTNTLAALTTQRMTVVAINLPKSKVITSITVPSGNTAAGTPTNQWFALYDSSFALLRVTSDDTTTAWATNTFKTLNLSSTFTTTYAGLHYIGIMVAATTVPTLSGYLGQQLTLQASPAIVGRASATGLTNPASAPNPADAAGAVTASPYVYVS